MMFMAAAAIAGSLTPLVIQLAKRVGALDRPAHRKATSMRVVPTLGGVGIFAGFGASLLAVSVLIPEVREELFIKTRLGYMVCAVGGIMAFIGIIDDRVSLRPRSKLMIQMVMALAVVGYGLSFSRISLPIVGVIELHQMAIPLTVVWFVGVTNALNLVDGIDGLACGVALVVALTVAVIALMTGNVPALIVAAALAGACAGFLPYNFAPARIFLGDSGSLFLGSSLAVLSLASSTKAAVAGSMLVPLLLLGYPTLDTLLVMSRRMLKGKPIFAGGRDHIHHRLLASGLTHGQSSMALYGFCAIFCLIAIGVSTTYDQVTMIGGLIVVIVVMVLGSIHLGYFSEFTPQEVRRRRFEFLAVRYRYLLARAEMELASTPESVIAAVRRIGRDFGVHHIRLQMRDGGKTQRWVIEMGRASDARDPARRLGGSRYVVDYAVEEAVHARTNGATNVHTGASDTVSRYMGGAEAGSVVMEPQPMIREKLRFPESRMSARVHLSANGVHPDLKLEHRIYLSNALQVAGRRLSALNAESESE